MTPQEHASLAERCTLGVGGPAHYFVEVTDEGGVREAFEWAQRCGVSMRILGKKVSGREVAIERSNVTSWDQKVETFTDRTIPEGKRVVLDKGHAGHRATARGARR